MHTFRVALIGKNEEHLSVLKSRVEATLAAEVVFRREILPGLASDSLLRQLLQVHPDVVLVDIAPADPDSGIAAIEILAKEPQAAVFAVGALNQPQVIIRAMRAGASEFLDRDTASGALLEAFARLHANLRGRKSGSARGKLITILSAKGGCGATTVAVNTAVALQKEYSHVALVDLAPLGHTSLHLNVRPQFGLVDALHNLHRMDASLLEGFMTELTSGLRLLAPGLRLCGRIPARRRRHRLPFLRRCGGRVPSGGRGRVWSRGPRLLWPSAFGPARRRIRRLRVPTLGGLVPHAGRNQPLDRVAGVSVGGDLRLPRNAGAELRMRGDRLETEVACVLRQIHRRRGGRGRLGGGATGSSP